MLLSACVLIFKKANIVVLAEAITTLSDQTSKHCLAKNHFEIFLSNNIFLFGHVVKNLLDKQLELGNVFEK